MMKRIILTIIILTGIVSFAWAEEDWKEQRSSHFIIYYKDAPEDFIKTVEKASEEYYYEIVDNLGFTRDKIWSWENRVKIYIYSDETDYVESAKQASWSGGVTILGSKIIRTYPSAHGFFDTLLPHELGHIIFREYVGFKSNIPLWVDEGIAMYQEKAKRFGVNKEVKKAIKEGQFIPLTELSKMRLGHSTDRETVELYYAEAASVVYYMVVELGQFKFKNFCNSLRTGTPFEQALHKTYYQFKSIEDLNKSWINYLER